MKSWLGASYEKLILFIVLFGLLLSVTLLGVFVDHEKRKLAEALSEKPPGPQKMVQPINIDFVENSIEALLTPFQVDGWTSQMMIAELRVACVKCGRPIPYDAKVCPYRNCGVEQPGQPPIDKDKDFDGIPDEWELKYGLNPKVDDSSQDKDNDGFTNLDEYKYGTDPTDPNSHPPLVAKLCLVKSARPRIPLSFQGVIRMGTDTVNNVRFVVKSSKQDHYVLINEVVEGYRIVSVEEKKVRVKKDNLEVMEDRSVLKLEKDGKVVDLPIYRDEVFGEWAAKLLFLVDNSTHFGRVGSVITLKNNSYKIVDIQKDAVVVSDELLGEKMTITPCSEAGQRDLEKMPKGEGSKGAGSGS